MRFVAAFARFWWSFVVGDEWRIAVGVGVMTALGALAAARGSIDGRAIALLVGAGLIVTACGVIFASGRRRGLTPPG